MEWLGKVISGGWLSGYKTYITAIVAIIGSVALYLQGDADAITTFYAVMGALGISGLRAGIAKSEKK